MTPRSLVGMTMGCRKRVVRARCWEVGYTLRRNRFSLTSDQLRALDVTERAECAKIRETYRIGQRLRPCPGCSTCIGPNYPCHMRCDGSGVLPARAKKVRR